MLKIRQIGQIGQICRIVPTKLASCLILLLFLASWATACQVPVFRYALERWVSDKYEILVINDGPLSDINQRLKDRLAKSTGEK